MAQVTEEVEIPVIRPDVTPTRSLPLVTALIKTDDVGGGTVRLRMKDSGIDANFSEVDLTLEDLDSSPKLAIFS